MDGGGKSLEAQALRVGVFDSADDAMARAQLSAMQR